MSFIVSTFSRRFRSSSSPLSSSITLFISSSPLPGRSSTSPPLEATMWRKVSSRPSVTISITIRNFFPVRAMSTASSTTWWRVPSRWVSSPTAAFPSSHVGMSTVLMIMAWRGSKRLFACLFPFYLLLCGATVYIQAHYLIDSIVGFVSAFGIYILATWMFKRWFAQPMLR
ncbi:phosphatase PAP2 family protein [Bacteroides uniformis]|uniref:phosphatase PAP2 family protein n=1 Tax=Bacteroides uniformis TaxID=820 RepID=UPI001F90C993|nr:phosphatase PAP2 family protein [Bacteroides uniformis]